MTTDYREPLSDDELAVLRHMREQSSAEPSAAVDALILAAARKAVSQPAAPSRWRRFQNWLLAGTHGQRWNWSLGVAGVASIALGLSLTWRHVEQPVGGYDQAQPMAAQPRAPKTMEQANVESVELKKQQPKASATASSVAADRAERRQQYAPSPLQQGLSAPSPAKAMAPTRKAEATASKAMAEMSDAAAPAAVKPSLRESLLQVLALRRSGETAAADAELADLMKHYPQQDVAAQLQQLEREMPQSPE